MEQVYTNMDTIIIGSCSGIHAEINHNGRYLLLFGKKIPAKS